MWHTFLLALDAAWKVLGAGLILGAGLPTLYALGVRSLAWGTNDGGTVGGAAAQPHPVGKAIAYVIFALVLLGVVTGITYIVASGFGKTIGFWGILPVIVDKH